MKTPVIIGAAVAGAALAALPSIAEGSTVPSLPPAPAPNNDPTLPPYESNLAAFLKLIRVGESGDNYRALVGGGEFSDFSSHPAEHGHPTYLSGWRGVLNPRVNDYSTAAGAYQIVRRTYRALNGGPAWPAPWPNPAPFTPEDQDRMAVALIKGRGAYDAVREGRISEAVSLLRAEWEFFQMARWNVPNCVAHFEQYGGYLA